MCQNTNPYWAELDAEQIYVEMIKRFPRKEYDDQNGGSMYFFFGPEWELLNPEAKNQAEEWFVQAILDKVIKGIRFDLETNQDTGRRNKIRDEYNDIVYWRIQNDLYRRD